MQWDYVCLACGAHTTRDFASVAIRDSQEATGLPCGRLYDVDTVFGGWCGGRLERQPSAPSLSFKGPGWTPKHYGGK